MTLRSLLRAFVVALTLWMGGATQVLAHALPGTVLLFSKEKDALNLVVSVNVEDLVIAEPALAALHDQPLGVIEENVLVERLALYFNEHQRLEQSSTAIDIELTEVELKSDRNDHVGAFRSVVLTFVGVPDADEIFPLDLSYDAVMHEVRNHRAAAYWQASQSAPIRLAEFGFQRVNGKTVVITLQAP